MTRADCEQAAEGADTAVVVADTTKAEEATAKAAAVAAAAAAAAGHLEGATRPPGCPTAR